ncbi:MAG: SDR family oxidoreductase [Planctomycetes bacterium]|nr:SDR family oxidoreductase [Planctomycetota bacterium]
MKLALVSGGAGFIGSHLVARLLEDGVRVRVLDNLSTGRRSNLDGLRGPLEFFEADLSRADVLSRALAGCDCVFHQAAIPSVPRSIEEPVASHEANGTGTLFVLEAARRAGVRRLVYAASSSAYGESEVLPKHEGLLPDPVSPYAVAKLAGEMYCKVYAVVHGMETVSLRYFNVFGPRQDPESPYSAAVPKFLARMCAGRPPVIYGDGEQSRDFTYVENVVEANLLAARAPQLAGQVVNIACGRRTTLNELVGWLGELLGRRFAPEYAPPRPGDIRHSHADIRRAAELLGYRPTVDVREGLARTVEWFLAQTRGTTETAGGSP